MNIWREAYLAGEPWAVKAWYAWTHWNNPPPVPVWWKDYWMTGQLRVFQGKRYGNARRKKYD